MRVLIAGSQGRVGTALVHDAPTKHQLVCTDADSLDVTQPASVTSCFERVRPDIVINAAGYTAVDRAEREQERCFAINSDGPAHLAQAAVAHGARLIHISTNYVFDGRQAVPYTPKDAPHPLNVYGASKLEGERRVREITGDSALILRTSWIYSWQRPSFVLTMQDLLGSRERISVVKDEVGAPTWTRSLACAVWQAVSRPQVGGVHHWTDAGVASWYDLAMAVKQESVALGILPRAARIEPIPSAEYQAEADRPPYGVLDCGSAQAALHIAPNHWRVGLSAMLSSCASAMCKELQGCTQPASRPKESGAGDPIAHAPIRPYSVTTNRERQPHER